eukprot:CAMPEP_0175023910 /NCGR_PEP_ID=MMETSP0005-20121125/16136_1 /TAXON_ID=420556 /ORGANISM="Ochromonas sp., Strain CCMP1393" /LENGTH=110 /DNA_ID=CAMNT_0016282329 /DNA_START=20 /DNA_END=352 /DNA_ORIENTATION=+
MPFIKVYYSGDESLKPDICKQLSAVAAEALGKPQDYVCVLVECSDCLIFGGTFEPACMIQVNSVGKELSTCIGPFTELMGKVASIPPGRVFVNFQSFERNAWGMNGSTFG